MWGEDMDVIKADNLVKLYGKSTNSVYAVNGISLTIKGGEYVSIIGPSGSGKSTLLHMLGGLDKPTTGIVTLDGTDLYKLSEAELSVFRRRRFGFIFQMYNLIPVLTVEENITLPLLLDNRPVDKEYINELLQLLGLADRSRHLPNQLSGGQQQRVAIGRALANKPSILFADEPTGNLDSSTSAEVMEILQISIKKYHQSLIMITHNPKIANMADRIIEIKDGIIKQDKVVKA